MFVILMKQNEEILFVYYIYEISPKFKKKFDIFYSLNFYILEVYNLLHF